MKAVQVSDQAFCTMPAFIASVTHPKSASVKSAPKPSQITLTVLNGSGVAGAAGSATSALDKLGFHTGTPQTASIRSKTTVGYPAGDAAKAKVVAGFFPRSALVASPSAGGIQVVLGADGIHGDVGAGEAADSPSPSPTKAPTNSYNARSCVN